MSEKNQSVTESQVTTEVQGDSSGPASDGLSAAELAYFKSGGREAEGLMQEYGGQPEKPDVASLDESETVLPEDDGIDAEGQQKDGKPRYVPLQALQEERNKKKALNEAIAQKDLMLARAEERIKIINDLLTASGEDSAKPAAKNVFDEEPIDPEVDIFGALEQERRKVAALVEQFKQKDEVQAAQAQETQLQTTYENDAKRFLSEQPDFRDAYLYLVDQRSKELEAMGYNHPGERLSIIRQEEKGLVQTALKNGKSPSAALYNLAKGRGFAVPQKDAENKGTKLPGALDSVKKGLQASGTLNKAGGSSGEGLTVDSLANMSEEEFAAVQKKLSKSAMRQLMGG